MGGEKSTVIKEIKKLQGVKRNKSYLQSAIKCLQKDAGVDGEVDCDICFDAKIINEVRVLQCGHRFCSGCVNKLQSEKDTCPLCRDKIAYEKPQKLGKNRYKKREKLVEGVIEKLLSLKTNEMRSRAINYLKKDLYLYNSNHHLLSKEEKIREVPVEEVGGVSLENLPHNKFPRQIKETKLEQGVKLFEQTCARLKNIFPQLIKQTIRVYKRKPSIFQIFDLPEKDSPILRNALILEWIGRSILFSCLQNYSVLEIFPNPRAFRSYLAIVCIFMALETTIRMYVWLGKSSGSVNFQMQLSAVAWFLYAYHISCQFVPLIIPSLLKEVLKLLMPVFSTEILVLCLWIVILL